MSFEEIRQAAVGAFKAVHDANEPDMLVNYPNHVVVDIEHQVDPFVSIALDMSAFRKAALGGREKVGPGLLLVYYYFQEGTGTAHATKYVDMLDDYLCSQQVGSLYFHEAKPISIKTFPGWEGLLISIKFDLNAPSC